MTVMHFGSTLQRIRRLERKMALPQPWRVPGPVEMAEQAGITLDDWQARMVSSTHSRLFLNCSRQSGKSLAAAILADHTAFSEPGAPVLLISASLRQAGELFRACLSVYRALGRPIRAVQESALRIEFANRSRIISLPATEDTTRGIPAPRLVIIDEASRVPDDVYMAVRPMLAVSGGRLCLLSTPWGERGFYWKDWKERHLWHYFEQPATKCKRIDPVWLEEERRRMGDWYFNQEFMCQFMPAAGAVFSREDIDALADESVDAWTFKAQPKRTPEPVLATI